MRKLFDPLTHLCGGAPLHALRWRWRCGLDPQAAAARRRRRRWRRSLARQRGLPAALVGALRRRGQAASATEAAAMAAGHLAHAAGDAFAEPLSRLIAASGDALAALLRVFEAFAGSGEGPRAWASPGRKQYTMLGCICTVSALAQREAAAVVAARAPGLLAALARCVQHEAWLCAAGDWHTLVFLMAANRCPAYCMRPAPTPPRRCSPLCRSCPARSRAWRSAQLSARMRASRWLRALRHSAWRAASGW